MTHHTLQGRTEAEVTWYQRRSFLHAAAAWSAMGAGSWASAQERGNIVELRGDATVNGLRLTAQQSVQTGDQIATGPQSTLIFTVGNSAFHVRQNSVITVERGATLNAVSVLRLITGAVVSVWGRGGMRRVVTPTLTAGIRGTGVYTEIFANQNGRSYFCNCYGQVELVSGQDRTTSTADYHQAFWGEVAPRNGRMLSPAKAINHTDEEVEFLAKLAGQRTAWQIAGKKGSKDGSGYMEPLPGRMHPAEMLGK